MNLTPLSRCWRGLLAAVLGALALTGCGGGDGYRVVGGYPASCSTADRQDWLGAYMDDQYFWYALSPHPSPSDYPTADTYFQALLYTGTSADFPADRWSYLTSTADFNRRFADGQTWAMA